MLPSAEDPSPRVDREDNNADGEDGTVVFFVAVGVALANDRGFAGVKIQPSLTSCNTCSKAASFATRPSDLNT